jgi:hypothetical protein
VLICLTDLILITTAGHIQRWQLPGHHEAQDNDNFRQAQYYYGHAASQFFNQLFAALYDLIISTITKEGLLVPCQGHTVRDILAEQMRT